MAQAGCDTSVHFLTSDHRFHENENDVQNRFVHVFENCNEKIDFLRAMNYLFAASDIVNGLNKRQLIYYVLITMDVAKQHNNPPHPKEAPMPAPDKTLGEKIKDDFDKLFNVLKQGDMSREEFILKLSRKYYEWDLSELDNERLSIFFNIATLCANNLKMLKETCEKAIKEQP